MTQTSAAKSLGFWERPATWKAVSVVVLYLAFYLAIGRVLGRLFNGSIDDDNILSSASSIVLGIALPIAIGASALLVFIAKMGWLRDIFGPQPVRGRGWMWLAPALVLAAIAAHLVGVEWDSWTAEQIVALVVVGVCVGLAEELLTRGVAVKMLRDAGHGERFVAAISSLLFALLHTANLLSGMAANVVAATVVYTFGFGMMMYLSMRVTGTIWAAIVLHGLTDPTTLLSTGGLDKAVTDQAGGSTNVATLATVGLIVFGFVAIFLIRGDVQPATERAPATA